MGMIGAAGALPSIASAQDSSVELVPAKLPANFGTPTPMGTPTAEEDFFTGDLDALWNEPWTIGDKVLEIGGTIVQRFIGSETDGFALGADGLVFRSVIYAKFGFQDYFFIGSNTDLSFLEGQHTFLVRGTYGGVQRNTDTLWDDPIIIAREFGSYR